MVSISCGKMSLKLAQVQLQISCQATAAGEYGETGMSYPPPSLPIVA